MAAGINQARTVLLSILAMLPSCAPAQEELVPGLRAMPGLPPNVRVLKDQAYALTGGPRNVFDLYLPRADDDRPRWPLVIWIHGGGFVGGGGDAFMAPARLDEILAFFTRYLKR